MSAEDDGVSMSTIEPATAGQNGAVAFATTHWSLVLTAQSESPAARDALEKLCHTYAIANSDAHGNANPSPTGRPQLLHPDLFLRPDFGQPRGHVRLGDKRTFTR